MKTSKLLTITIRLTDK